MNTTLPSLPALLELQARPQWVCWRKEQRQARFTKVPYDPRTHAHARSNDPVSWTSYQKACQALAKNGYTGIGYMFHGDYTGVDLDHCVQEDGRIEGWAQAYLDQLPSYAEYSPSGTGIHIIVRGVIPCGLRRPVPLTDQGAVEMYCQGRYFTVTGRHVEGTPTTLEECPALQTLHTKLSIYKGGPLLRNDEDILQKAMLASNGAKVRALWEGKTSGYASASEADLALCSMLAFWTGQDVGMLDRLFRRSALYRADKWDRSARAGETYGQGTIARALSNRSQTYSHPISEPPPDKPSSGSDHPPDLPFVLDCLRDQEEGDGRLFARLFEGQCLYDHSERAWYLWQGHFWAQDHCQKMLLLASGPLAAVYEQASIFLVQQHSQLAETLIPNVSDLEQHEQQEQQVKSTKAALLKRAKDLKRLCRTHAVLTYAQAYLPITSQEWDKHPWLLGTHDGVLDLRTGLLRDGAPTDYIRTVIPTAWKGLDEPAPRFERFLQEVFADRATEERQSLIEFLQRVLGYGLTGDVSEHLFLMLYGEQGRNGKDTLTSTLQHVLGRSAGPISNEVVIANGRWRTPGTASPHLCTLHGKRIAWVSETEQGARFDVGQVKWLTGGGSIIARPLYANEYVFQPSHLLILLTNHKPHADASDAAFWSRLRLIKFHMRFVDDPVTPHERRKDAGLERALQQEASGILAWLVRGCLSWQAHGMQTPPEVKQASMTYHAEEDTVGQFLGECCVTHQQVKVKAGLLYQRYQEWMHDNGLNPMGGPTFGSIIKKRYEQERTKQGICYCGLGLLETEVQEFPQVASGVGGVGGSHTFSVNETPSSQREKFAESPTPPTPATWESDLDFLDEEEQTCELCLTQGVSGTPQAQLMAQGKQLGYPLIEVWDEPRFCVEPGRACWLDFAQRAGAWSVQRALQVLRE